MKKTVGPVKEVFLVYNNSGLPKGYAVITFARTGDALLAIQSQYNIPLDVSS